MTRPVKADDPGDRMLTGTVAGVMDGVLLVNKEAGWTSHDVVAKVRQLVRNTKVGHAGTLDPAATGLLPVLVGKGTRVAEYLVDWDKEYRARLRLGEATDTQDATGIVLQRQPTDQLTPTQIHEAVGRFRGAIQQVPPMFSAVKISGVPLYKSARAGHTIVRDARPVTIHELEVVAIDGRDVSLRVACSKGTYIRTLCADIGASLGVGGHLLALQRVRVGPLGLDRALTIDELATHHDRGDLGDDLLSLDQALRHLPVLIVDEHTARRVRHGVAVPLSGIVSREPVRGEAPAVPGMPVRIQDGAGQLLAIGRFARSPQEPTAIEKVLVAQE